MIQCKQGVYKYRVGQRNSDRQKQDIRETT